MTAPAQIQPPPLNTSLQAVSAAAITELAPVWEIEPSQLPEALMDVLPGFVEEWALAASSVAADWYDELRETVEVRRRFTAIVEPLDYLGAEALAGWGSEALQEAEPVLDLARYRVEGGLQKRLVNAASRTVTHSASEDPAARGYMRRTRPGACPFCRMVASRGGVYTKATSTFACHEHCYCEAVPAWGGRALPVGPYKPSDRPMNDEDRARVRAWIAANLT